MKNPSEYPDEFFMAGAVGIEPTLLVLETRVLPLNDAPTELAYGKLLIANSVLFKRLFKRSNPFNQNFGLTIYHPILIYQCNPIPALVVNNSLFPRLILLLYPNN